VIEKREQQRENVRVLARTGGIPEKLQIIRDSTVNRSLQLPAVMVLPAGAWWL